MNKKIALFASLCMLVITVAISAQDKTENFFGEWTLDLDKSELGERSRVESMTMMVSKTVLDGKTWLTVTKTTKRAKREEGERGLRGRMGRGRGGEIDGQNVETLNYDLSGKENTSVVDRGRTGAKATAKIKYQKDGSMIINQKTEFDTPRGSMETKNTEIWVLSADGKTLTVSNELETPRGNRNSKMVFKNITRVAANPVSLINIGPVHDIKNHGKPPSRIEGGVINGKAISLPSPAYPVAAQAAGIRGSVSVQVIIDKEGKVMSAKAVSGHVLLRKASVEAARKAEFRPTMLSGQPVEVSGIIIYNYQ